MSGPDAVNDRLPLVLLPALLCDEELYRAQVTAIVMTKPETSSVAPL